MFDRISGVYDPMNLAISAFQEPRWRRALVRSTGLQPGDRALDVATGTGKVAADLQRAPSRAAGSSASTSRPAMIASRGASSPTGPGSSTSSATRSPCRPRTATFDAATIAFGMRNLPDYRTGFAEMARSVRPGGRVVCLEIARPQQPASPVSCSSGSTGSCRVIGRVAGQGAAYGYLVRSVKGYPAPERIAEIMREAGLVDVSWRGMSGGIVTLHVGTVPGPGTADPDR